MENAIGISPEKATVVQGDGLPEIGARLDRLASSKVVWRLMILLAFGGFFDAYMISSGSNIAPGLFRSHLLTATTASASGGSSSRFAHAASSAGHTVSVHLTAPVTLGAVALAVVLAIAGGLFAGAIGGWRAVRLRPAAALARVE